MQHAGGLKRHSMQNIILFTKNSINKNLQLSLIQHCNNYILFSQLFLGTFTSPWLFLIIFLPSDENIHSIFSVLLSLLSILLSILPGDWVGLFSLDDDTEPLSRERCGFDLVSN